MKTKTLLTNNIIQVGSQPISMNKHVVFNKATNSGTSHHILSPLNMKMRLLQFIGATLIAFVSPMQTFAQAPNLGIARGFALYTGNGALGNIAASHITGHIGTHVGAITGFDLPTVVDGNIEWENSVTAQCLIDVLAAYDELAATPPTVTNHTPAFGTGETLTPGVYNIAGAGSIAGNLTLDAEGDPSAIFIFQFGGAFSTGASSTVHLINGAIACNVFWAAEAAISMAASTDMKGTLISHKGAVSMGANGILDGRMLTGNGAVNVYQVLITVADCCDLLELSAAATGETCAGDDGSIDLTITGPAIYNVTVDGVPSESLVNVTAGGYTISNLSDGMHNVLVYNVYDSYCEEDIDVMIQDGGATYNLSDNVAACLNENVTYHDGFSEIVTENTSHASHLLTTQGCDSIIVTNVTITSNKTETVNESVCFGALYTSPQGNDYGPGSYNETYNSAFSCDSIVTYIVSEQPEITHTVNESVCYGEQFTSPQGNVYGPGAFDETYTGASSCDSVVTFVIKERLENTNTENETVCFGAQFTSPQGNDYGPGSFEETYTSTIGCDSIVTFVVTERLENTNTENELVCFGAQFTSPQGNNYGPGSFEETYTSTIGCDSIVTFVVSERIENTNTQNELVCFGVPFTSPQGNEYGSGSFDEIYTAATGCDSIVTFVVSERPENTHTVNELVCFGVPFTSPQGNEYGPGSFDEIYTAASKCDSTVTFVVTERLENTHTVNEVVCFGALFTSPQGNAYGPGSFDETYTAASTCDSVVTFSISELPAVLNTVNKTVCFGSQFTSPQGNQYGAGSFDETYMAATGCDSVVTFDVAELPAKVNTVNELVCFGYKFMSPQGNNYGVGSFDETCTSASGCDSIITYVVAQMAAVTNTVVEMVCIGDQYITNDGTAIAPGTYTEVLKSSKGCDSVFTLIVSEYKQVTADFYFNSSNLTEFNSEAQFDNTSSEADFYTWDFGDKTPKSSEESPSHKFQSFEEGTYNVTLIASNEFNCADTIVKKVLVKEQSVFYIPNAFTPDGDGYNQVFKPVFSSGYDPDDYSILIFSRWGEVVFESHDSTIGWDGSYKGQSAQEGLYTWKVQFKELDSVKRQTEVGHVNMMR
jgi:gliding motility-associated-like protein